MQIYWNVKFILGNLHFANVLPEDEMQGRRYGCVAFNEILRTIEHGDYHIISPQGGKSTLSRKYSHLNIDSFVEKVALRL